MSETQPAHLDESEKLKRKAKNLLLKPGLQTALGLYSILLAIGFGVAIVVIIYVKFADLFESILLLTEAHDEVREIVSEYWKDLQYYIYATFGIYLLGSISLTIWYTHKLIGPTIAFKRHIRALANKDYRTRTHLRKKDAFQDIASALNDLSSTLEQQNHKASSET